MDDTKKMLRIIINGQSSLKSELLTEIKRVEKGLTEMIKQNSKEINENKILTKKNGKRLDMIGKTLAVLDDDAPTSEEFEKLKARVQKIEQKMTFA